MAHIIATKDDALTHIGNLYPIGQDERWDQVWLNQINEFGIGKLPEELLKRMAKLMVENEGDEVILK